ncbi:MAG: hypothetical protein SYC29_02965 [Planctomycetota bacterium]|nr:hypothetical protein [Planctomycetota bacterium]
MVVLAPMLATRGNRREIPARRSRLIPCWANLRPIVAQRYERAASGPYRPPSGITGQQHTNERGDDDFNGDCIVDAVDLLMLLGDWDACEDCPTDLNEDGVADTGDLLLRLGAWRPCV